MVSSTSPHCHSLHYISWKLPDEGWIKFNCDGSVDSQHRASCGGIGRDAAGRFLAGFAVNLGCCPITVAEVLGGLFTLSTWPGMMVTDVFFWRWTILQQFNLSRGVQIVGIAMQWL